MHFYCTVVAPNLLEVGIYTQLSTNAFPSYLAVGKDGLKSDMYIGHEGAPMLKLPEAAL